MEETNSQETSAEALLKLRDLMNHPEHRSAVQRTMYEARLIMCQFPDPDEVIEDLKGAMRHVQDPFEKRRCVICIACAELKWRVKIKKSRRKLETLLAYFVYVFSNYPAPFTGEIPQGISIRDVTLDMIRGQYLTWEKACLSFRGAPNPHFQTKRRLDAEVYELARELGLQEEAGLEGRED